MTFNPVLFDLDGTVIDTVALIRESHRHAVSTVLGRDLSDEELVAGVGKPLLEQMRAFSVERAEELHDVYRVWNHANTERLIASYPGILELLEDLRDAGRRMGIVTSKARDAVDLAWRSLPLEEFFDVIITADDGDRHKPNPDPILQALGALGADAGGACYVGDAPFDIRAGNAAGTTTIAVTWGFFTEGALSQEHPDRVCHSVDELRAMLLGPS